MADITFAPGVYKEETAYSVGSGWIDSNLMRFRNGSASPIGGWTQRANGSTLNGVCTCIKDFSNLSGSELIAFGTNTNLYIMSAEALTDITPAGFISGPIDSQVATGWGIGPYNSGTWGTPRTPSSDPFAQVTLQPLIWSLDNFGQDLLACPYAEVGNPGPIYIWHANSLSSRATLLSADPLANMVPALSRGVFVNPQAQTVIAVGCTPIGATTTTADPMQIRWSDLQNPYNWNPSAANSAGDYRLSCGSYIVGWLATYYENIFWTDTTVYSMQLIGNGLVYGFNPIGQGLSMISPKAAGTNGSSVFFMDHGAFYIYSGSMSELPCPLKDFLFGNGTTTGDINRSQEFKIFAGNNHLFSEMWWYYPSASGNGQVDSYVTYNYKDGVWANGRLGRTAWSDTGHSDYPISTDYFGNIWSMEYGTNAVTNSGASTPLPWSITSGDLCIENGDVFTRLERIIPDFVFNGPGGPYQTIYLDVRVRNSSSETPRVVKTCIITPDNSNRGFLDMNIRGRRVSFRFYNNGQLDTNWIMGKTQVQYVPAGRR